MNLISRQTVAQAVTESLREQIVSGRLPVGTVLRQEEIARELGVSRTPLREAITRLAAEGLIRNDTHRGAVVRKPSQAELDEAYLIRETLEGLAARHAAERTTAEDIERLRATLAKFDSAANSDEWAQLNTRFHMEIYELSGLKQLSELIASIRNRTELFVRMLVTHAGRAEAAHQDHLRILDALSRGDPDAAEAETRNHLRETVKHVRTDLPGEDEVL